MSNDPSAQKKRKIQIIAIGLMTSVFAIGGLVYALSGEDEIEEINNLGPSDSMVPADPTMVNVDATGSILATPSVIDLSPTSTTQIFTLLATGVPLKITDVRVPAEVASDLRVTSIDCPAPTEDLMAGSSCSASVEWSGLTPVSTTIEVIAASSLDPSKEIKTAIPVRAEGVAVEADIAAIESQQGPPVTAASPSGPYGSPVGVGEAVASAGPSPEQMRRAAYVQARRQGQLAPVQGSTLIPTVRSPYASWNNVGAPGNVSSNPTDMSRVITPDKAITAVIANPIDTRMAVTAVAMVDRDIYGNNGRTVVVPRGSKLIGRVGGGVGRIGIAWNQLIRPDGVRFMFAGESGDAMGRGGIPGRVNEQLLKRYGYSLLPPAVAAAITVGLGGRSTTTNGTTGTTESQDAKSVAAEILTQPLQQISNDLYQRNSQTPAQTTVPAGTRITVWSIGDLRLKPIGERDTQEQADRNRQTSSGSRARVELPTMPVASGSYGAPAAGYDMDDGPEGSIGQGNYPVGEIDENGNYIAPGMTAPAPSQAPLREQGQLPRSSQPARPSQPFAPSANPWQN